MFKQHSRRISLVVVSLVLLSSGCNPSDKLSKENVDRVKTGMTVAEVEAILGTNEQVNSVTQQVGGQSFPAEQRVWKGQDKEVQVNFLDGKVTNTVTKGL